MQNNICGVEEKVGGFLEQQQPFQLKSAVTFQTWKEFILEECQFVKPDTFCCYKQGKEI